MVRFIVTALLVMSILAHPCWVGATSSGPHGVVSLMWPDHMQWLKPAVDDFNASGVMQIEMDFAPYSGIL